MKTAITSLVLGSVMAFALAGCSSTGMNSDGAMGSSGTSSGASGSTGTGSSTGTGGSTGSGTGTGGSAGTSGSAGSSGVGMTSGVATGAQGMNSSRSSTPVNCTNNTTASGTDVASTPGMNCPNESH